uniref:Uncharacterized protein n=1 Tax=Candidatus Kentrum sp. DK TaxID=2126562 RepID=A0A450SZ77_9GAMM|nr:MAG: hypothetical protein BECKDK2373C_GA0170839_107118 [Candidatus Kentron sp. DK]
MREKTIFVIYAILVIASFAPFFGSFLDSPMLTIGWVLGDLFAIVLLTMIVHLKGYFENVPETS